MGLQRLAIRAKAFFRFRGNQVKYPPLEKRDLIGVSLHITDEDMSFASLADDVSEIAKATQDRAIAGERDRVLREIKKCESAMMAIANTDEQKIEATNLQFEALYRNINSGAYDNRVP